MLLGRKLISPNDKRRYAIDYDDWLDVGETITATLFTVDTGPALATLDAIAGDGRSLTFFVSGALLANTPFNVAVRVTTSLTQIVNDHIEFDVVAS